MLETTNHTTGGDRPQKVIVRTELRAFLFLFLLFSSPLPTVHPTPDRPPPLTLCSKAGGTGGVCGGEQICSTSCNTVEYVTHHSFFHSSFPAPPLASGFSLCQVQAAGDLLQSLAVNQQSLFLCG